MSDSPQKQGGIARSKSLSPEERVRIAQEAARARWEEPTVKAVFGAPDKPIKIADIEVPCYILEDGRRVITSNGLLDTFGMARGGAMKKGMNRFELFASQERIRQFVSDQLFEKLKNPIRFRIGRTTAYGFESDTLIDLAEAVVKAADKGALQTQQLIIAHQCRVVTSSLTRIGLIALIDEATGYQQKRETDELQKILTAYLLPEHRPWLQVVPEEFSTEVYRVYGWQRNKNNRGPRYAGKLIRKLIYERMPKPILPNLDELNPSNSKYQRKHRHHQFLTEKQGLDHFRAQVITVMTILRLSRNKEDFKRHLETYYDGQMSFSFGESR